MIRIHTILHPTDFSESAAQALEVARALARDHGATLVLMTVPAPSIPAVETYVPEYELVELRDEAERQVKKCAEAIADVPVETRVIGGEPGWAIVSAAKDCHADLIVMGTHGRKGLSRLLLGSVAEHVLRHAPCPVLTIKPGTGQTLEHQAAAATGASSV